MTTHSVKVIAVTGGVDQLSGKSPEDIIGYIARVSNPPNQEKYDTMPKLLKYCIKNAHWSIFEQASMTIEIETSLAIATQILRHRSFTFQQFSGRYAEMQDHIIYPARRQDLKNRQNSIDDLPTDVSEWFTDAQTQVWTLSKQLYDQAINKGIAKEQARMLLPTNTRTRLYMTGNVRSWIHYLELRSKDHGAQKEHADIAEAIKREFITVFPIVSKALEWTS